MSTNFIFFCLFYIPKLEAPIDIKIIAIKNNTRNANKTPSPQPRLSNLNMLSPLIIILYDKLLKSKRGLYRKRFNLRKLNLIIV